MGLPVKETSAFTATFKKLHAREQANVDKVIRHIADNPLCGEQMKGDLAGVFVWKFRLSHQLTLLAYRLEPDRKTPIFVELNLALVKKTCAPPHYVDHIDRLLMAGQLAPAPEPMSMAYLRTKRLAKLNIARPQAAAACKAPKK